MTSYCASCFRDLPSDDAQCRSCSGPKSATSAIVLGLLVFAIVITGVLTLDARLCIAGAAFGIVALTVQLIRG